MSIPAPSLEPCIAVSAQEEQQWIEAGINAGAQELQWQLVRYQAPALIYGRSTRVSAEVAERCRLAGCEVVQRRTGGGAVFAGPWMLGCNLLIPAEHPLCRGGHIFAFSEFGSLWMRCLSALGVPCSMTDSRYFNARDEQVRNAGLEWSCFAGLSHGEGLDQQGRKLVGVAQARGRWGTLLSAGVLLSPTPWETLEFLHHGRAVKRSDMHQLASDGIASFATAHAVEEQLRLRLPQALEEASMH